MTVRWVVESGVTDFVVEVVVLGQWMKVMV
jgi:hypothetical protein